MHIGDKIKLFREKRGISQAKMAEILNMSVQGYGNIESGDINISFSRLFLISKELGVTPEQIVGFGKKIILQIVTIIKIIPIKIIQTKTLFTNSKNQNNNLFF